jgi:hypothetical protein
VGFLNDLRRTTESAEPTGAKNRGSRLSDFIAPGGSIV